jgi:hypothetical protein
MNRRKDRQRADQHRNTPVLEGLEVREVLSVSALIASSGGLTLPHPYAVNAQQTTMMPTPHEARREQFLAQFKGAFVTGAPRFTDQISQTYIRGGGTSNFFLHGDLQMAFAIPTDPSQPITGQAVMIVKNVANTGNELILDLLADPTSLDQRGQPTRFTWTVDPASGGLFTGATGQGTAQSHTFYGGRTPFNAKNTGHAAVVFQGSIFISGLTSTLRGQ